MELTGKILNDRYRIGELIADGRLFSRYGAMDMTSGGEPVEALFISPGMMSRRSEDLIRFRAAVKAVSGLTHGNILRVREAGDFLERAYIVTERHGGATLADAIAAKRHSVGEGLSIVRSIADALAHAHGAGVVHRCLTPSMVILTPEVKLTGFGIAHIQEFPDILPREDIEETLGYLSPEQCGLLKRSVDERSDLYSVGVILYRLITGSLPFTAGDALTLANLRLAGAPGAPRLLNAESPPVLEAVTLKLLDREPDNRYQSAAGLIHDLDRIAAGDTDFAPGLNDRSVRLSFRARFVGRDSELDRLKALYREARAGRGSCVLITGKAGSGKTRLTEELRDFIRGEGGTFVEGKCRRDEMNFPYKPFREILGGYLKNFQGKNESQREAARSSLRKDFSSLGSIITSVHPGMADILGERPPLQELEPDSEMKRFLMVLGRFFSSLSRVENGLVLLVDDLQWSDTGSSNLVYEMMDYLERSPLLVIGTCREEDLADAADISERFITHHSCLRMDLGKLDAEGTRALVSGILLDTGSHTADTAAIIYKKSQGNPFIAITIIKHLVESGALRHGKGGWRLSRSVDDDIPISIVDIIVERIKELSDSEKEIIACAAVIGKEFDFNLLSRLSDLGDEKLVAILDRARSLQIFEEGTRPGSLAFFHDRIMEAFSEKIGLPRRKELHLKIARALESLNKNSIDAAIFELAHHYIESGDDEKTIQYAFPAAVKARENHAYRDALRYFRKTAELLERTGSGKSQLSIDCVMETGFICATVGEYDEAVSILTGILPDIAGTSMEPRAHHAICNAYYRKGDWKMCEEHAARGLSLLGDTLPRSRARVIAGIVKELAIHFIHVAVPGLFVRKKTNPSSDRYRHIINFYEPLGMSYALNDPLKLVRADLRILNISERHIGPSAELAMSLYAAGSVGMAIPIFPMARKYLERALAMNTQMGNEWGTGKTLELLGYNREWQGNYAWAREYFNRSIDVFTRLGDAKELAMALNGLQHCYYYTAEYRRALETNDRYYELVNRIHDDYSIGAADIYYSQCLRETGDLECAADHAEKARARSAEKRIWFNYCSALNELGCHALETGNRALAIERLEEARALHEENTFLKQYMLPIYVNLAQAYLDDYQAREQSLKPAERKAARSLIRRACSRAIDKTRKWPTHHAGALRVMAGYQVLAGHHDKAEALFNKSIRHARRYGRRFEELRSLYDYGLLLFQKGHTQRARETFETAYQICVETGANLYNPRISTLLGIKDGATGTTPLERMLRKEQLLSVRMFGYKIRSISDPRELLDEVIAKAVEIAGARRGFLYVKSAGGRYEARASHNPLPDEPVSPPEGIMEKVLHARKYSLHGKHDNCPSITVPIRSQYQVIGACHIDLPLAGDSFSDSDGEFLQEFLSDVGSAVEKALTQEQISEPVETGRDVISTATEAKVKKAMDYIEKNYTSDISREGLAASLDINPDHLGKAFKAVTGEKISDFINRLRIRDAAGKLVDTNDKIIDIAFSVGYESLSTFNRAFLKEMNTTPQAFRKDRKR